MAYTLSMYHEGRAIDLLLLTDPNYPEKTHYVWIKDLALMLHKKTVSMNTASTHAAVVYTSSQARLYWPATVMTARYRREAAADGNAK